MVTNDNNSNGEDREVSSSYDQSGQLIVSVEGNIGSGKSTFLDYCRTKPGIDVHHEPIGKWQDVGGENLLLKFYQEPKKWAMALQLQVNMTMLDIYKAPTWRPLKFIERSLLSSRHCFMKLMKENGNLEPAMCTVLEGWYDRAFEEWRSVPQAIAHIYSSPDVAYSRVRRRARTEEETVPLAYLEQLHQLHNDWIRGIQEDNDAGITDLGVYTINANQPIEKVHAQYDACIEFMDTLRA